MKCSKCQFDNPDGMKFCGQCGNKLDAVCGECGFSNPPGFKFCGECGHDLSKAEETAVSTSTDRKAPLPGLPEKEIQAVEEKFPGERKYVTALFSDMSGYTAMSEKLDPEEVKEITSQIFKEISEIIGRYDGFIEKFIGDAVMALFGVPKAHEDDPIRAVRAAREIHERVRAMSPELEERIGKPLSMHTGINTGLVVTGEVNMEKGTHGVAGDTINVAARLSSLAAADEIVIGPDTYHHVDGFFDLEPLEPTKVKGKAEPIRIFKVLSPRERPDATHRHEGLRADLIGREVELIQLKEAVEILRKGKGGIFSICGETGIGKTRLVEEFKDALDLNEIQWLDGQAYAYSQNYPYFPLIDLLNKGFQIREGDAPAKVREKLESGVASLVGKNEDVIPYLGSLYALNYPEMEQVSPELWKSRLQEAVLSILSGLAQGAPTIICLEDLHWADPSSMDLLRFVLSEFKQPALFICVHRPGISLFTSHQVRGLSVKYNEIRLNDLSLTEAQAMLASLLKAEDIPRDLWSYVQENVGGNPFYLEEVTNALIGAKALVRSNGAWRLDRPINQVDLPSTIHGLIAARLDHLESESKRILQEASVIGRSFLYDVLRKVTDISDKCDMCLSALERMDMIKARSLQPELEYVFNHALTQEVVYNGLLMKEREEIHGRIAGVMEDIFSDRLPEFYETLAFHYRRSPSKVKAVEYLVKAGKKCLARYSVEEAQPYFQDAYDILREKTDKSSAEKTALIDMLAEWGYVFYYLGDINTWIDVFNANKDVAESLDDPARLGMYYAWMGIAYWMNGKAKTAFDFLMNAKDIGEKTNDQKVIGYACTWLTWACGDLGRYDEGLAYGEKAQEIARSYPADQYLFFKSLGGMQFCHMFKGDKEKIFEGAQKILKHGEVNANSRARCFGHWVNVYGHWVDGDMESAIESNMKSGEAALDPFYSLFSKLGLGMSYFFEERFPESERVLQSLLEFCDKHGVRMLSEIGKGFLAPQWVAKGQMNEGLKMLEECQQSLLSNERISFYANSEIVMGAIYAQIATGPKPGLGIMARNIGFLAKNAPAAAKRAEEHFKKAIEICKKIGAKWYLGLAYLELGRFYKAKKRNNPARECLSEAVRIFKECDARFNLKQAEEALSPLEIE
ncbi:MAG: AAA family ATPase [Deltaproteobacteria bacterium]|nr:AAA family ATPase [Deltaproteobacteria bacterium]